MDILYVVNQNSQDVRWGHAFASLSNTIPLGFNCHRVAAMPGNRYLYVTGNKSVSGVIHAWLAVVDTCDNTVVEQLDLGVGFAGQCAVPAALGGNCAYVAVSQAVGTTDTGSQGGTNRIVTLDVANLSAPTVVPPEFSIPGSSSYGTLHVVWSDALSYLYTAHRGDHKVFQIDLGMGAVSELVSLVDKQPMSLGLSQNGQRLFIGTRRSGELVEVELNPLNQRPPQLLQNAATQSTMYIAVDRQDSVLVTATRPSGPHPADGILNVYSRPPAGAVHVVTGNTQGNLLGQPAISPAAGDTVAYVPRGGQNDIISVRIRAGGVVNVNPIPIGAGTFPTDIVALADTSRLECDPPVITTQCNSPQSVVVTAHNMCNQPVNVSAVSSFPITVMPAGPLATPATFQVECLSGGARQVQFAMSTAPFASVTLDVQCNCLASYCFGFATIPLGPLPQMTSISVGSAALSLNVVSGIPPDRPGVRYRRGLGPVLQMHKGSVRFQVPAPHVVGNLVVRLERTNTQWPIDLVTVTHSGGTVTPVPSPGGSALGDFDIPCLFQDITEWTIQGGPETYIKEICFDALF